MIVVSDAGPLVALAKIERFELLQSILIHLCMPQAVYDEVVVKGAGRAGTDETEKALGDWIDVLSVKTEVRLTGSDRRRLHMTGALRLRPNCRLSQ